MLPSLGLAITRKPASPPHVRAAATHDRVVIWSCSHSRRTARAKISSVTTRGCTQRQGAEVQSDGQEHERATQEGRAEEPQGLAQQVSGQPTTRQPAGAGQVGHPLEDGTARVGQRREKGEQHAHGRGTGPLSSVGVGGSVYFCASAP